MLETAGEARQLGAFYSLQAYYDAVSGLPNQVLFMDRLAHALLGACRRGSGVAVLFIEAAISTPLTGEAGMAALMRAIGERLEGFLRPNDTLARLAGCQFLALTEDLARPADAAFVAGRLIAALERPFAIADSQIGLGVTIGVAVRAPVGLHMQPDELVLEAERALQQAQRSGSPWTLNAGAVIDASAALDSPCAQQVTGNR